MRTKGRPLVHTFPCRPRGASMELKPLSLWGVSSAGWTPRLLNYPSFISPFGHICWTPTVWGTLQTHEDHAVRTRCSHRVLGMDLKQATPLIHVQPETVGAVRNDAALWLRRARTVEPCSAGKNLS